MANNARKLDPRLALLFKMLDPGPGRRGWHGGPSLMGALRGVPARAAAWKPGPRRRSIWELALHIAYWKYAVRRHLAMAEIPPFPRSPANWPALPPAANEKCWKADRELLAEEHAKFLAAVAAFPPAKLGQIPPGGKKWTYEEMISGVLMHDLHHIAQVQLLKRLAGARGRA